MPSVFLLNAVILFSGVVAFIIAAVGVVACLLPAVRAAKVDPAVALRAE